MAHIAPGDSPGLDSAGVVTRGSSTSGVSAEKEDLQSKSKLRGFTSFTLPQGLLPWRKSKSKSDGGAAFGVHSTVSAEQPSKYRKGLKGIRQQLFGTATRAIITIAAIIILLLIILLSTLLTQLHKPAAKAPSFNSQGQTDDPLVVDVSYGKYRGVPLNNGIVQWLGMRYAGPPTGPNRFAAPIPPTPFSGVRSADAVVPGCHGLGPKTTGTSEDCVSIDVYSPASASATSKLPVYLFIQGGGNQATLAHYNGSNLIQASGMNMVFATITYRVGAYGFLASSEVQSQASLNNGYKDQRQAMQWVKDHIANFGGDPDSITLGGQSAGAGAMFTHLTAYGKSDNDGLFHSAIIESPSTPPLRTPSQQQFQYDDLVSRLNCTSQNDTLACLRAVPHSTFLANVVTIPYPGGSGVNPVFGWNPVLDNDLIPISPLEAIGNGTFVNVPTILGDVTSEGAIFTPHNLTNTASVEAFVQGTFPNLNSSAFGQLAPMYNLSTGNTPTTASPPPSPSALTPGQPPVWQLGATLYGDMRYTCPSTEVSSLLVQHGNANVWRYRFDVGTPSSIRRGLGATHGAELPAIFGAKGSFPGLGPNTGSSGTDIVTVMQGFWSSFVATRDPNAKRADGSAQWGQWDPTGVQRMHFLAQDSAMETVSSAEVTHCDFMQSIASGLGQ